MKSASARSVELEWSGTSGPVSVERRTATAFQKLATSSQTAYQDTAIDAFATYHYRVSANGKSSNEVVVGPPPSGVLNAAPVPKGTEPPKYGAASAIALDENGDAMIAFEWIDPNKDGDNSDTDIRFVRWSRAAYKWLPPVRAQIVGDIQSQNLNPISLACDRKSGMFAIVAPTIDKGASILLSKDGGATWTSTPIPGIGGTVTSTAIAIVDGTAHLALASPESVVYYFTGSLDQNLDMERRAVAFGRRMEAGAKCEFRARY